MNGVLWQEACWRQSGSLLQLLRLDGSERKIAMVGAGGKTTVLFGLARELQESGRRVLVTTTTHIWRPAGVFAADTPAGQLGKVLREQRLAVFGRTEGDKLARPAEASLKEAARLADIVLIEADGSHGLPAKFPARQEPVLAGDEDLVLAVGGWSAVGRPLRECCHRAGLAAAFLQKNEAAPLLGTELLQLLCSPLAGRKSVQGRFAVVLNQLDSSESRAQAAVCIEQRRQSGNALPQIIGMGERLPLAAVLLAAGLSRRMGETDKLLQDFAGRPLFAYGLELAASLPDAFCCVVSNTAAIREEARAKGMAVTGNPQAETGIASSIVCGVHASAKMAAGFIFMNLDQPLLSRTALFRLVQEFRLWQARRIIVPRCDGRPQSPCIFPAAFREELTGITGDRGGRQVYQRHPEAVVFCDFSSGQEFLDIDTIEDREAALAALAGKVKGGGK